MVMVMMLVLVMAMAMVMVAMVVVMVMVIVMVMVMVMVVAVVPTDHRIRTSDPQHSSDPRLACTHRIATTMHYNTLVLRVSDCDDRGQQPTIVTSSFSQKKNFLFRFCETISIVPFNR